MLACSEWQAYNEYPVTCKRNTLCLCPPGQWCPHHRNAGWGKCGDEGGDGGEEHLHLWHDCRRRGGAQEGGVRGVGAWQRVVWMGGVAERWG